MNTNMNTHRSSNHKREQELDARVQEWLDGDLSPEELAEIEAAIADDPALRAEAEEFDRVVDAYHKLERPKPSSDFAANVLDAIETEARADAAVREPYWMFGLALAIIAGVLGSLEYSTGFVRNLGLFDFDASRAVSDAWNGLGSAAQSVPNSIAAIQPPDATAWMSEWGVALPGLPWLLAALVIAGAAFVALNRAQGEVKLPSRVEF